MHPSSNRTETSESAALVTSAPRRGSQLKRAALRCGAFVAGVALVAGAWASMFDPTSMPVRNSFLEMLIARSKPAKPLPAPTAQDAPAGKEAAKDSGNDSPKGTGKDPSTKDGNAMQTTEQKTKANTSGRIISRAGYDITPFSQAEIDEMAKKLSPADAKVILAKGTEPAFCGTLLDNKKKGTYVSKLGGLPLFSSSDKFDSGTGWPSFFKPVSWDHIKFIRDTSHGMDRVEILDAKSGAHLGHVFEDGPKPTGLRFCLNSASLEFVEEGQALPMKPIPTKTAYFAGGCFWGVEDLFQQQPGVINAVSGYQGGTVKDPTYKQVCTGTTGHAETVAVTYDPTAISYEQLLAYFFRVHNPTTLNYQGPDHGTQYRSAIFAADDEQFAAAKKFLETNSTWKGKKVVTEVKKVSEAGPFYQAEEYHQDYNERTGHQCPLPE